MLRPLTLADFFLVDVAPPATACSLFAAPGVGDIVHCHLLFVLIQAAPSLTDEYTPDVVTVWSSGSTNHTCPPVLLRASLVSANRNALKAFGAMVVPDGIV
jgi:hypothetical protein